MSIQAVAWAIGLAGVTPSEKLVLIVVANYADDLGFAWPSQDTLSSDTSMSLRTVRSAIQRLEERGLLQRRKRYARGERSSDMLHLAVGCSLATAADIAAERSLQPAPETVPAKSAGRRAYRQNPSTVPAKSVDRTGNHCRESVTEPSEEPSLKTHVQNDSANLFGESPPNGTTKPSKAAIEAEAARRFESDFWPVYPRRTGKKAARAKFIAIVARGEATADQIVRGAMRYAAARTGEEERYTKQPVTWLNQGCWDDEYPPPRRDRSRFGDRPKSLAEIMLEQTADSDECSLREVEPRSLQ